MKIFTRKVWPLISSSTRSKKGVVRRWYMRNAWYMPSAWYMQSVSILNSNSAKCLVKRKREKLIIVVTHLMKSYRLKLDAFT